jgi:hypothetical protein
MPSPQTPEQPLLDPLDDCAQVRAALIRAGLSIQDTTLDPNLRPLSPEQRDALAEHIYGRPPSEMIVEEREPR